ncbi:DUF4179 domain-containing protein [uncultured Paenibacillus sp.]|uniref:DUF4179 domain-containing protein n=1 Tax=uncultured Paenibacillus sp. TaxID=227322 RepID=UPI0015B35F9E|nr:DUF4179 domain-containing protein [uncultured Paenibacillus sp.]
MVDQEENQLFARYFDGVRLAEKQVRDEKLDAAIRRGLDKGKTLRGKWQLRRGLAWTAGAAGTLAVCLLLLFVWQNGGPLIGSSSPTTASQNDAVPSYVSSLMTSEMERAAEHGLYQPVGKSTEVAGTKVTVDGVLADGRTVVVFYSMVNPEDVKAVDNFYGSLIDKDGNIFINLPRQSGTSFVDSKDVKHTYFKITFDQDAPTQAGLAVDSRAINGNTSAKIPFEWSSRPYANLKKTIPVNQTATLYGKQMTVDHMVLRPLSTTLLFKPQKSVDKAMTDHLEAKLYLGEHREDQFWRYTKSRGILYDYGNETGKISTPYLTGIDFESLYYTDWNEVTLQIDGFGTPVSRTLNLAVDTDKKQLITPNPAVEKIEVVPGEQSLEVRFHMNKNPESKIALPYHLDDYFTDDEGTSNRILRENGSPSYRLDGEAETISFKLESRQYPQPLNFTLTETLDYKPQQFKIPLSLN